MKDSTRRKVLAALIAQTAISAVTYLAASRAMKEIPAVTLLLVRLTATGALFSMLLFAVPGPVLPPRRAWPRFLLFGVLAGPVNQGFFLHGLSRSSSAHAALLYALTPLGVYALGWGRGRERFSSVRVVGILVALLGVVVLLLGRGLAQARAPLIGDLFILGAVLAWVVFTAEGKPLVEEHGALRGTAWSLMAAALLVAPSAPFLLETDRLAAASPTAWACLAFIVVVTSVISYLLWYYAISHVAASKAAIFNNVQPVATALLAWAVFGEPVTWELWTGGALVLAGVSLTRRS